MRLAGMQWSPDWRAIILVSDEQRSDNAQVLIAANERILKIGHGLSPAKGSRGPAPFRGLNPGGWKLDRGSSGRLADQSVTKIGGVTFTGSPAGVVQRSEEQKSELKSITGIQ